MRIKRIVVPTDLSQASLPAIAMAAELAKKFASEVTLVYAVEPYVGAGDPFGAAAMISVLDAQERAGKALLARHERVLKRKGLRVRSLVAHGAAAPVIVETARKRGADLIVMGTHGRTGMTHLLMGSVAERVVRTAGRPVLTVPVGRRRKVR